MDWCLHDKDFVMKELTAPYDCFAQNALSRQTCSQDPERHLRTKTEGFATRVNGCQQGSWVRLCKIL